MVQIVQQNPGAGEMFAAGLGQGISQGMQALTQKLEQYKEHKKIEELTGKWDENTTFEEKYKDILNANVSKESKQLALGGLAQLETFKQNAIKQQQKQDIIKKAFGNNPPSEEEINGLQQLQQPQQQQDIGSEEQPVEQDVSLPEQEITEYQPRQNTNTSSIQQDKEEVPYKDSQIAAVMTVDPNLARVMLERNKVAQKQSLQQQNLTSQSYKETAKYRNEVADAYKAHREDKMIVDRMKSLNKKDLASPFQATVSKFLGIPISILSNPESEEFEKLTASLTRNIRQYYGARITNLEMSTFLRSIPSLMNSTEGRERVIKGLNIINKPKELEFKALQKLKKEYRNKPLPFDLQEQIIESMEGDLDDLAVQFKNISSGDVIVTSPEGKQYKLPVDKAKEAEDAGWSVER